jgi:hypothetical protein
MASTVSRSKDERYRDHLLGHIMNLITLLRQRSHSQIMKFITRDIKAEVSMVVTR